MAALTPALSVVTPRGYCARLEQFSRRALLKIADSGGLQPNAAETLLGITAGDIANQALQLALDGYVEFDIAGQTETNDTVTTVNLSDLGVDFLTAGTWRRLEVQAYITADADAGVLQLTAMVAGGSTPLVAVTKLKGIEDAATATSEGGIRTSVAAGDFLASSLIVPVVSFEQNSNKVRLTITGITNIDMFWRCKVRVFPLVAQTFPVTD